MLGNLTARSRADLDTHTGTRRVQSLHKNLHLKRRDSSIFKDPDSSLPYPRINYERSIRNLNYWLKSKTKSKQDKSFEEIEQASICVLPISIKYPKEGLNINNINLLNGRLRKFENLPSNHSDFKFNVNYNRSLNPFNIKGHYEAKPANDAKQAKFNELLVASMIANKVAGNTKDPIERNESENLRLSIKRETEKLVNNFEHLGKTIKMKGTNFEKIEKQVHKELSKNKNSNRGDPQMHLIAPKINNFYIINKNNLIKEGIVSLENLIKQIMHVKKVSKELKDDLKNQIVVTKDLENKFQKRVEVIVN
jgi:hypothetical protein